MIDHVSVKCILEAYAEALLAAPHDGRTNRADRSNAERHSIPFRMQAKLVVYLASVFGKVVDCNGAGASGGPKSAND